MGMSSSQARLLHLTSRMHQIEYKAAKLEAEKLQMANESSKVYETYLDALEQQKIAVSVLGADGAMTKTDLTANLIYNYGKLGEQYALVTKDDKTLISSSLHTKYQNTNSLTDFLADLGLNDTYVQTIHHSDPNPAYQTAVSNFNNDHATWSTKNTNWNNYQNELDTYNDRLAAWTPKHDAYVQYQTDLSNYNRDYATWQTKKNARTNYETQYANWQTEHAAWETRNQSYTDYETLHAQWVTEHADWVTRNNKYQTYQTQKGIHDQWLLDKAAFEQYKLDKAAYDAWEAQNPENIKGDQTQPWWETGEIDGSLAQDFILAGGNCYNWAKDATVISCYGHVLSHIIDYDGTTIDTTYNKYETTLEGKKVGLLSNGDCDNKAITDSKGNPTNSNIIFKDVSDVVSTGVLVNIKGLTCNVNESSTDYDKLLSKFDYRTGKAKTIKQWCIDLLYISRKTSSVDGYPTNADGTPNHIAFGATIEDIQNTLSGSLIRFKEPVYNQAVTDWEARNPGEPTPVPDPGAEPPVVYAEHPGPEPIEPTRVNDPGTEPPEPPFVADPGDPPPAPPVVTDPGPAPTRPTAVPNPGPEPKLEDYIRGINQTIEWDERVTHSTFTDKELTQWYINVWCKMEGLNETPLLSEMIVHDDATNTNKAIYSVQNKNKSITTYGTNPFSNAIENDNYIVIKDAQLNDNTWITNTVQNGEVLIQSWDRLKGGFVDTSVATNVHLNYVDNNINLKKAEAQYEADMLKIDKKDRRYDTELARLENERNAISQEMDTLKTVAKENVERTFKLFS